MRGRRYATTDVTTATGGIWPAQPRPGLPPLSAAAEEALAARRDAGDQAARDELVTRNIGVAILAARPYLRHCPAGAPEIAAAALEGLLNAAIAFDPARARFSTCAVLHVRKAIREYLEYGRPLIRVGGNLTGAIRAEDDGRPHEERPELVAAARRARAVGSLDTLRDPADEDDPGAVAALVGREPDPSAGASAAEDRAQVDRLLRGIDRRSRRVLTLRFGLDGGGKRTMATIGAEMGLSRARVEQLERHALARLRKLAGDGLG